MSPKQPTKLTPSSPPKLSRSSGIIKKTQPKESPATTTTIKSTTVTTTDTTISTAAVPSAPLPERPQSPSAESTLARRILESLVDDHSIDQRISVDENEMLLDELTERQQQIRWAIEWCIGLEDKYDVPNGDRMYRPRPLKRGRGYSPSKAARTIMVKMWEREEEEEEEPKYKTPGSWVD